MGNSRNYKIGIDVEASDNASGPIGKVAGAADSLDDAFGTANKNAGGLGASLTSLVSPAGLALGAVTAIGGALVATGAQAMNLADQVQGSSVKMQTQLGLSQEKAGEFQTVMEDIYRNNYGESFEDIGQSLVAVEEQFGRLGGTQTQEQLQEVTTLALSMRDAFGFEVSESVGAVTTLMENFGLTSTQAFDLIVAGQQRGLNASGDLLDSIGEYSVQFSQGGASAEQFFSILETGQAGGVLGTDKMADAFKEFNIRIIDDSETTKTALSDIGLSYDTLKQGFADGSITQVEAMQTVIDKLNEIDDPIERNKAGVALFGTQWEDLSAQVILEVDTQKTKLSELEGSAASLETQYQTNGAAMAAATRQWETALADVGKEMNIIKGEVLPGLASAVTTYLVPALQAVSEWLADMREGQGYLQQYQRNFGGYDMTLKPEDEARLNGQPSAEGSSLAVVNPANSQYGVPIVAPGSGGTVNQNSVSVYVERGDPEVVADATELGINRAQQMRGE